TRGWRHATRRSGAQDPCHWTSPAVVHCRVDRGRVAPERHDALGAGSRHCKPRNPAGFRRTRRARSATGRRTEGGADRAHGGEESWKGGGVALVGVAVGLVASLTPK